ncbi:hypothetical protein E2C01_063031 [Portunus trituberculatus]|uniref:Uncharacterized protein n=1 Tax=Portunus trituberculatus TaxID=210409 RepID=A0A5B7H850_PORTR|nr:hypothetical protein [Portunus trituberculatus]
MGVSRGEGGVSRPALMEDGAAGTLHGRITLMKTLILPARTSPPPPSSPLPLVGDGGAGRWVTRLPHAAHCAPRLNGLPDPRHLFTRTLGPAV